ncbi:MAG: hypothetical protein CME71_03320 [Halobacteriovorax sp.]|nr:hypothetical protein [Halobacteriovorax sp.]
MRNLFLILSLIGSTAFAKSVDWREHNPMCANKVEEKVKSLKVDSRWVRFIAGEPGSFAYRAPIEVGLWAEVIVTKKSVTVSKMTEMNAVSYQFETEDCVPQIAIQAAPKDAIPATTDLGDVKLKKIVESGKSGIIYIWSPSMTLSPKGYHHVAAAAKKFGVELHSFVDPSANEKMVEIAVKKARLPASITTPMQSFDLTMRGATLHYPATFIFKDGKISRWAKHGYENDVQFEQFIKRELAK